MLSQDIQHVAEFLSRYKWTGGYLNPTTISNLVASLNALSADAHQLELNVVCLSGSHP